jgi:hypothetical protein
MANSSGHLPSEHHVEFREAEDERVAFVDEDDVDVVAECIREDCRQLEAPEAGAEDDYSCFHRFSPGWTILRCRPQHDTNGLPGNR